MNTSRKIEEKEIIFNYTHEATQIELNIYREKKLTRNVGREEKHLNLSNAVGALSVDVSKKESSPLGC